MGTVILFVFLFFVLYVVVNAVQQKPQSPPPSATKRQTSAPRRAGSAIREPSAPESSMARPRASTPEACWVGSGEDVRVGELAIPGGMLYVGKGLRCVGRPDSEPALINPDLKVDWQNPDVAGARMGYWPSYSQISAQSRAAYLGWLAGGRKQPGAYIGYVFLYFYGLERRILVDARESERAAAELPHLAGEVRRLLALYGNNDSFRGYAAGLLDVAEAMASPTVPVRAPTERVGYDVPLSTRIALGRFAADGRPVPAEWAFAWAINHPQIQMRTPATRCPREFAELFHARYQESFGDGMIVSPDGTRIVLAHRPASSSFGGTATVTVDLPDVTRLPVPTGAIARIADTVQDELEAYSRWVGRTQDRDSMGAVALLPEPLLRGRLQGDADRLRATVEHALTGMDIAVVSAPDLLSMWPVREKGKLTKTEAVSLADFLERLGYGLEPDVRHGAPNPGKTKKLSLFRLGSRDALRPERLVAASALLHLGAAIADADDDVAEAEERHLERHLETALGLNEIESQRLRARLRWLLADPPTLASVRKLVAPLPEPERHAIGRVLLAVAGADGHVSAAELKVLGKVYPLLGLDANTLYADVHDLAAAPATGPVTVLPADDVTGYTLPAPRVRSRIDDERGVTLDLHRVEAIRQETGDVTRVLHDIFAAEEGSAVSGASAEVAPAATDSGDGLAALPGLDTRHSALVRAIAERAEWSRAEIDHITQGLGLLSAGAIEVVNEAAYTACDEPLLEGEDPVEVNRYALEEMMK